MKDLKINFESGVHKPVSIQSLIAENERLRELLARALAYGEVPVELEFEAIQQEPIYEREIERMKEAKELVRGIV